ncbi:hypothetical protein [uncultured Lacinutrix sp.]|uniref:hypothetical protein n=1 Tax=uncultured Lacinutrix sp. TaxID=574032 RepID=UPI00260818F5|nr:hypothetical protein [uncultured Lacinutrix sp.]
MKKLNKFFGVFAVTLLLMSMSSSSINLLKKNIDCFEIADINANDVACEVEELTGHASTHAEWYDTWLVFYDACMN